MSNSNRRCRLTGACRIHYVDVRLLRTCQVAKHRREGLDIAYAYFEIATPPEQQAARNA